MKKSKFIFLTALLLAAAVATSCRSSQPDPGHRGIYHWKTTYDPTEWEKQWLVDHKVDRLYVRLFDVDAGPKAGQPDWKMVPIATTQFRQPLPADLEVVPVVYITVDAVLMLENTDWSQDYYDLYARLLVKRIDDMMAAHYQGKIRQVQLDCDWTDRSRNAYFRLANEVKDLLHQRDITLSGTLRLHQLPEVEHPVRSSSYSTDSIPFDFSLLMCYNTGRLQDPGTHNSILDFDDVRPYLQRYGSRSLPRTDVAFPVYGWGVEFDQNGSFRRIVSSRSLSTAQPSSGTLRQEWGEPAEIYRTQRALPSLDPCHTTILYHLDSLNLSRYSYHEIEKFYSR